jgi:thiosulfate/3-mercaptopyruvate sulfurtransferase
MRDPRAVISTSELAALLGHPTLRVYDCTTTTVPPPPGSDVPYVAVPGLPAFEAAHIPGADFLDIQGEFSDQSTKLRFMMPSIPRLEAAFGRHGLGPGTRAVLYSSGTMWMSTRFWWMLRSLGCDATVLEGGFEKWRAEGRLTESGNAKGYPPATFVAAPRPGLFVDKAAVLDAIGQAGTVIVNALGDDLYKGTGPAAMAGPGAFPIASRSRPPPWSIRPARASPRWPTLRPGSRPKASRRTSTSSPIAAAAFRRPSTCSCCTSSATTTSHCMMPRWVSGRATSRYRLKPAERYKSAVIFSIAWRAAYGLASPSCLSVS